MTSILYNELKNALLESMCIDCTDEETVYRVHQNTFCIGLANGLSNGSAMNLADEMSNLVRGKTKEEVNALAEKREIPKEITWKEVSNRLVPTEEGRYYIFRKIQEFTRENEFEIYRDVEIEPGDYDITEIQLLCHEKDYSTEKQRKELDAIEKFIEEELNLEIKDTCCFEEWEIDEEWGLEDYYTVFKIWKE